MPDLSIYTSAEAAEYLGMTRRAIEYHMHVARDLVPDRIVGRTAIYSKETLDSFKARRRKPGRPPRQTQE